MSDRNPQVFNTSSKTLSQTVVGAKGDLIVGDANDTTTIVNVGANNTVLVANSSATGGINWSATLSGLTLTAPTIATITNGGTVTLPSGTRVLVARDTPDELTNKTLTAPVINAPDINGGTVDRVQEDWTIIPSAPPTTVNFFVNTGTSWFYTTNTANAFAINVWAQSATSLTTVLGVDDSITISLIVTCNNAAHYPTSLSIDGVLQTVRWNGGVAPTSGTSGSLDVYSFTIIRQSSSYTVLGSATRFG